MGLDDHRGKGKRSGTRSGKCWAMWPCGTRIIPSTIWAESIKPCHRIVNVLLPTSTRNCSSSLRRERNARGRDIKVLVRRIAHADSSISPPWSCNMNGCSFTRRIRLLSLDLDCLFAKLPEWVSFALLSHYPVRFESVFPGSFFLLKSNSPKRSWDETPIVVLIHLYCQLSVCGRPLSPCFL